MYTEDTTVDVWAPTYDRVASKLNAVLARLYTCCCENCLTPHPTKTEYMLLSGSRQFIIIIKSHRTSRRIRPPRCLTNPSCLDPALFRSLSTSCLHHGPHVPATDDRLSLGGYYGTYRPLGFRLALTQERHCSPGSNTSSQCCLIINASGFCNS